MRPLPRRLGAALDWLQSMLRIDNNINVLVLIIITTIIFIDALKAPTNWGHASKNLFEVLVPS